MGSAVHFKKLPTLTIHQITNRDSIILGTAQIIIQGENTAINTRALCDNGSQVNLITTAVVQQLRETPRASQTSFIGVGGNTLGSSVGEIQLKIKLRDGSCMVGNFFVVKNITNYRPQSSSRKWDYLGERLADINYNKPGRVHVLLGVSSWIQLIKPGLLKTRDGASLAHDSWDMSFWRTQPTHTFWSNHT